MKKSCEKICTESKKAVTLQRKNGEASPSESTKREHLSPVGQPEKTRK